jgi:threonine dehydrogenase-like Zn-dependent dehydrogenase
MQALVVERKPLRFAAARMASEVEAGRGARVGPLRLKEVDEPVLPGPGWLRVRPRLAGICGSDLATIDARSSRWFESVVSFPFTPGHEVVGDTEDGRRVVLEAVLGCRPRGLQPRCPACAAGASDRCERLHVGGLEPGLQTGFCCSTGGGWSQVLVADESQVHEVPDTLSDESAVMVEPTACALHAALSTPTDGGLVAVLGAGTLGLCTTAAVAAHGSPARLLVGAKHPEQRRLARLLGATDVVSGSELPRAVRRSTGSFTYDNGTLTGGADVTYDCVGSSDSITTSIAMTRPGGTIVLVGMPATVTVDLTPLWQQQIRLQGAYAYGVEPALNLAGGPDLASGAGGLGDVRTFAAAIELVARLDLGQLVSARYPLDRYVGALDHAAHAGARGAVKIAFAPQEKQR